MCIFAAPVEQVTGTNILVAPLQGDLQLTCYANTIAASSPNAMVLPVPLPSPDAVDEVSLINLQGVDYLFEDLRKAFPYAVPIQKSGRKGRGIHLGLDEVLEVMECGSYKVSIAPTLADLERVDRQQLPLTEGVDAMLKEHYGDGFAFLVCAFQKGEEMHPMAYVAPMQEDGVVFVPTKHEHGDSGESVDWDHSLFSLGCRKESDYDDPGCSPEDIMRSDPGSGYEWRKGERVADLRAIKALQDLLPEKFLSLTLRREQIKGDFENRDMFFAVGEAACGALCLVS